MVRRKVAPKQLFYHIHSWLWVKLSAEPMHRLRRVQPDTSAEAYETRVALREVGCDLLCMTCPTRLIGSQAGRSTDAFSTLHAGWLSPACEQPSPDCQQRQTRKQGKQNAQCTRGAPRTLDGLWCQQFVRGGIHKADSAHAERH